jgi:methionyl-tRNA formyltransferase
MPGIQILLLSREPEGLELEFELKKYGYAVDLHYQRLELARLKSFLKKSPNPIIISFHYPFIIKEEVLCAMAHTTNFNVHNSYLPFGRGIYGILWSAALDTPQGWTIHRLEEKVDAGKILAQRQIEFDKGLTLREVWNELEMESKRFVIEEMEGINELYKKARYSLSTQGFLRNKNEGKKLLSLLPKGFDSTLAEVRMVGLKVLKAVP